MLDNNQVNIEVVIERIAMLHDDVKDLRESTRDSMRDIAVALNKLVVIETHQASTTESFSKLLNKMEKLEEKVNELEKTDSVNKLVTKWVLAGVWSAVVAAGYFISKAAGLM